VLQHSVVDIWVQSDRVLLIHPCLETLPFGSKGHKIFQENMQVLGAVIAVLHYKSCLKWRPPTSLHVMYRLAMLC
jgi:hypothetical protein